MSLKHHLDLQEGMWNPIVFHTEMTGDIMYYNQAIQQPDVKQFANAIVKEVNDMLIRQKDVPKDVQVVPSIWAMRCKRSLTENKVIKHKARLNLHGGKDELLQDICNYCYLVCNQAHNSLWHHFLLGPLESWFCYGAPSSSCWVGHLHETAPRYQDCSWKLQGPCNEATQESQLLEASCKGVEFIPCGQAHLIVLHLFIDWWLCLFSWWHHFHGVCVRWYPLR